MNEKSGWWVGRPWRMIQTNLREIDMLDIDAKRYVAELQEFKANVAMINAAGIIASYPTELSYHFQSPFLKGDSLKKIIAACHDAGIKVIARTDFSKVRRPVYEAHPEWAYVSPKGEIIDYNGDVHVCINGDYQQVYALKIMQELFETHDFDGIFFNMGGYKVTDYSGNYYGICHCEGCKKRFYDMYKLHLPKAEDKNDSVYLKYMIFKKKTVQEYQDKVYNFLKEMRPDLCIANNLQMGRGFVRQESNTAIARPLPHWQYSASDNTKWVVSSYPEMVSSNTTVDFIDFPYRYTAVSPYQQKLRLAQNLANGGSLDYYLMGRLDNHEDKSGFEGIREMYRYHAENEDEYQNITSKAEIGLFSGADENNQEYRGWFRFLAENHYPFDTIRVERAIELDWGKYKAVIIPDYQPVGDELAEKLDNFAASGGIVISVAFSGFSDASYEKREMMPFKCLGVKKVNIVKHNMSSACFKIDKKTGFNRFPVTDLIYIDGVYVYADYTDNTEKFCSLIPPHMFGPPERCYYTDITDYPAFTINTYGKGKGVYIPWEPGSLYYRQGYTNTLLLIADLLENILGLSPVKGNLSPMIEVTRFIEKNNEYELIHLVNASGHFGVSFFEPVKMSDIKISFDFGGAAESVVSLTRGGQCSYYVKEGKINIEVPSLDLFEAIKITKKQG